MSHLKQKNKEKKKETKIVSMHTFSSFSKMHVQFYAAAAFMRSSINYENEISSHLELEFACEKSTFLLWMWFLEHNIDFFSVPFLMLVLLLFVFLCFNFGLRNFFIRVCLFGVYDEMHKYTMHRLYHIFTLVLVVILLLLFVRL